MISLGSLLRKEFSIAVLCKRSLFNENFLGITDFKKKRAKTLADMKDNGKDLIIKLQNVYEDPEKRILTHQIKQLCYIINKTEDVEFFGKLFEKYCKSISPGNIIFQDFNMGPEIMRMYYVLNMPIEGLSLLQNSLTLNYFNDLKSYGIIQDLLYNHGMYEEVCEIFSVLQDKQIQGRNIPFLNYVLFQAACYKLNTAKAYNDALKYLEEFIKFYKNPVWPVIMYTMILALENEAPEIPLKYPLGKDSVSINIKLAALMKKGAVLEALKYFDELSDNSVVIKSVALDLKSSLEKLQNDEQAGTKISDHRDKIANISYQDKTLEELAAETMYSLQKFVFSKK